jgi:hypothetical protein
MPEEWGNSQNKRLPTLKQLPLRDCLGGGHLFKVVPGENSQLLGHSLPLLYKEASLDKVKGPLSHDHHQHRVEGGGQGET